MSSPYFIRTAEDASKLWIHEISRVFSDRLINDEDEKWY